MIRMIATSMNKGTYDGTLTIYCHEELVHTIKTLTKLTVGKKFYKHFDERIVFHVIAHGDTIQILGDSFTFFDIGSTKEKQFGFTSVMENGLRVSFPGDEPYRESLYDFVKILTGCFMKHFVCMVRGIFLNLMKNTIVR